MTSLALAIATKGAWDPDQLLHDLRSAGADASTEIHIACDPEHAPATAPDGLAFIRKPMHPCSSCGASRSRRAAPTGSRSCMRTLSPRLAGSQQCTKRSRVILDRTATWALSEPRFGPSDPRMIGYLTEYVQFHRPLDPELKEVPGSNLVLPRQRVEATEDFSKTRLLRQGLAPRLIRRCRRALRAPIPIRRLLRAALPPRSRFCCHPNSSRFSREGNSPECRPTFRSHRPRDAPRLAPQRPATRELRLASCNPYCRDLLVRR